ncbi:MAG TPA: phage portal protein [Vicinamibacterales bacterium]|nr:phage portal protein [Vicinamibacterales bacterium]
MGILSRAIGANTERRTDDTPLLQWARGALVSIAGTTGRIVTEQTALSVGPVYACVRILAETLASMPLELYLRTKLGKIRDVDHALYWILHDLPNPEVTSYDFRNALMGHLILWGNAYAEIQRNAKGEVIGLWPLLPNRMQRIDRVATNDPKWPNRLRYWYRLPNGQGVVLYGPYPGQPSQVFHLRGLAFDAIRGYSPMRLLRDTVGLTQALEEFGSRFFGNSTIPGGILQAKGKLNERQVDTLKQRWEEAHRGLTQSHRVAVLEEGYTWQQLSVNPDNAQFIQARLYQLRDVARIFRISPHLLQDLERATFANIEQLSIEFIRYTMKPWMTNWEQTIARDIIGVRDLESHFAAFDPRELLQGDLRSMIAAYAQGIQWGIYSANDVREKLGDNPRRDDDGDRYLTPMNMVAGQPGAAAPLPNPAPIADVEQPLPSTIVPDDMGPQILM